MKVLAVGDIHQKSWILNKVDKLVKDYDKIVFVGDYADDFGAKSAERIDIWREMKAFEAKHSPKVKLLVGNHDFVYLHDKYAGVYTGWDGVAQLLLNSNTELKKWLQALPLVEVIDGITYSHAGITDSWDNETPLQDDGPLWVRPQWGFVYKEGQVFGHTPSETCWEVQKNVWCIDTFSTYKDGTPFGDQTVLEIIDGKEFRKIKLGGKNGKKES